MVLLVLAALWGIVLIPPAWRAHSERRRQRSVDRFRRTLQVLAPPDAPRASRAAGAARPAGAARSHVALIAEPRVRTVGPPAEVATPDRPAAVPPPRPLPRLTHAELLARRRMVLAGLVLASLGTAAAVVASSVAALRGAHLLVDIALVAYVAGLRRLQRLAVERQAKVRYLPAPAIAVEIPAEADEADTMPLRRASASS